MKPRGLTLFTLVFTAFFGITTESRADAPQVVASIKPVHSLVAVVMKGVGEPTLLVNGAGSPHTYALRPSEVRILSRADIVFWVGPDFEIFLQKPLQALASNALSVALMDQSPVMVLSGRANGLLSAHEHQDARARDGHIWLDPINAIAMVQVITRSLQKSDAVNAKIYADNAAATIFALENLDAELRRQLEPLQTTPFVVFHDAFQYFEKRYGLNAIGSVVVTPEQMTSVKRIATMKVAIERLRPACIYSEPSAEPGLLKVLLEGTDLRLGTLDPEGAVLSSGRGFYFNLMRKLAYDFGSCLSEAAQNVR